MWTKDECLILKVTIRSAMCYERECVKILNKLAQIIINIYQENVATKFWVKPFLKKKIKGIVF